MITECPAAGEGSEWALKTPGSWEAEMASPVHPAAVWSVHRQQGRTRFRSQKSKVINSVRTGRVWSGRANEKTWGDLAASSGSPGSRATNRMDKV